MNLDKAKELTITVPTAGQLFSFSTNSFQTNEGSDTPFGYPISEGERLYMQWETVTPLVDNGGTLLGVLNFAIAISDQPNLVSAATQILSQGAGVIVLQAISGIGYTAADFATQGYNVVGAHFSMELPAYIYSTVYQVQSLPYIGACLTVPTYQGGANSGFSAGAFKCRIVKDVQRPNFARHVRSRMPV